MSEYPISFSNEMVRAILDGRKTQTRRPITTTNLALRRTPFYPSGIEDRHGNEIKCKYGKPGDFLLVRNAFYDLKPTELNPGNYQIWDEVTRIVRWQSGHAVRDVRPELDDQWKKHSASTMPRWASVITLIIDELRVQRVQDISEVDAKAEGVSGPSDNPFCVGDCRSHYSHFRDTWDSIYKGKGFGWSFNPWVWVIKFKIFEVKK